MAASAADHVLKWYQIAFFYFVIGTSARWNLATCVTNGGDGKELICSCTEHRRVRRRPRPRVVSNRLFRISCLVLQLTGIRRFAVQIEAIEKDGLLPLWGLVALRLIILRIRG